MQRIHRTIILLATGMTLISTHAFAQSVTQALAVRTQDLPDQQPQVKRKVNPVYPEILKRAGMQGEAFIKLSINENGKVDSASVLRSVHEAFGIAAKEAALQWEFVPPTKNGKPIRAEVVIPFKFALAGDEAFYGLITAATDILRGKVTHATESLIDPEAYAVVGHRYELLHSILFEKTPPAKLVEGEKTNVIFSSLKSDEAKKTAVLVLKTGITQKKLEHFHTVVFMKSSEGVWKIKSWHASE